MVDTLNGQYKGQNLMKLVNNINVATIPRIKATVPVIKFRKYKMPINKAMAILNFLSVVPILCVNFF